MINLPRFFSVTTWGIVGLVCLASFSLMLYASRGDSLITDELAHIPAGYSYIAKQDFRLNPEHPPLLKALSALPLAVLPLNFPTSSSAWTTDVNGQWTMGTQFIYESGNDADTIVQWSRLGPMLLTILLILLVFHWSAEIMGPWWALVPTILVGFSPNFLAHGHYVTTDVVAAFGVIFSLRYFLKFLDEPSRRHLLYAGLAFGVAQAGKFSAVLLIPLFLFLIFARYILSIRRDWHATQVGARLARFAIRGARYLASTLIIFAVGYALIIYPLYFAFTRNYPLERQVSDTKFILQTYGNGPTPEGKACQPARCMAELNILLAGNEITRPAAHYLLGVLMVTQRAAGGNTAYFLGDVTNVGSRLYFPAVFMLKEPLPVLVVIGVALFLALAGMLRSFRGGLRAAGSRFMEYASSHFTQFAIISFVVLYWAYSLKSPLNIGFRHLFPTLPLIYMLAAGSWKRWISDIGTPHTISLSLAWTWLRSLLWALGKYAALVVLLLWFIIETLITAPYFLSYFNQLAGGTEEGYRYVTDSNYDWGQDMLRLRDFLAEHPEIDKIALDHFGGAKAEYYLGDKVEGWWSARGNPADHGIRWFVISVNSLQGSIHPTTKGYTRPERDEYRWLTDRRPSDETFGAVPTPDYRVGTVLFVYHL